MSDLVGQLRTSCVWCQPCVDCAMLMLDAAEEIERLRNEVADLQGEIDQVWSEEVKDE